jgi:hypothetical protein
MATRSIQLLNALDFLTEQHTEIDRLFERLEEDDDDGGDRDDGDRKAAFAELADRLAAHSTIEEKLFYPRLISEQTSELLHQAVEEHLAVKRVLADMVTMDLDADEFKAKLAVLKEEVSHHAHEEEEAKLFPILRKLMDPDELAGLGNELVVMFEQLIASEPRFEVPKEIAEAAPLYV